MGNMDRKKNAPAGHQDILMISSVLDKQWMTLSAQSGTGRVSEGIPPFAAEEDGVIKSEGWK